MKTPVYDNIFQPEPDPADPYSPPHIGLFERSIQDGQGKERPYCLYVPSTLKSPGNSMLVFIPGKEAPKAFFDRYTWKESLEKHATAALFVSAPDGWNTQDPGPETDVAAQMMAQMRANEYFTSNGAANYVCGFGDGAAIASVFAVLNISVLAAWAAYGDTTIDEALLDKLGNAPSDCDSRLRKRDIPLPTFLIDDVRSNTLNFFLKACHVGYRNLNNGFAQVYQQKPGPGESYINAPVCSEVWYARAKTAQDAGMNAVIEKMVSFLENYKRWAGEGNGHIRVTQREEDLGLIRHEKVINGLLRRWHVFEPSSYKMGRKEKYPLVIAIHGYTCSGPFFAENSGWHQVAEERGFLLIYPSAYPNSPSKPRPVGGMSNVILSTPEWNSGGFTGILDPDMPDDLGFFKEMLADTQREYPVDPERIYVTGHSNGASMTQCLMRYWPRKFAGFAPVGFMECLNVTQPEPRDGILRNVWYCVGEFDGPGCSLEGDNWNTRTLKMICESNGIPYDLSHFYESGIYGNTILPDGRGWPLVRYTAIQNWPHTYTPELAFHIYDQFFSRYRRLADGSLRYLNKEV